MTKHRFHRTIATFFIAIFIPTLFPINTLYASNNGPNAPEAMGFEPVTATDMVNLASGDMSYVLPIMDIGGFPITMSYHGGIPMDLESTWTGLGWNLNTGAINRNLNAAPDDWNGGNSLDFIKYKQVDTQYNINVGYGISRTCEVGIGASWGSNKALSGSVYASVGFAGHFGANASIGTDGNYSLGVGANTGKAGQSGVGGGIGISGNVNEGGLDVGVGAGIKSSNGMSMSMGTSLTGNSTSMGIGYADNPGVYGQEVGGGGSISMSSFSQGDWDITSKGWYIPIQVFCVSFGFGKQKITYDLEKAYRKVGFGILYTNNVGTVNDAVENITAGDNVFNDYQHRYRYSDAYDQTLPVSEKEFVGDYDAQREKLNFTYAGYDGYDVNATGISGTMKPRILQNSTLYGLGYSGNDVKSTSQPQNKIQIYNHNSNTTDKTFGKSLAIGTVANDIEFYFDGQFTANRAIEPLTPIIRAGTTLNNIANTTSVRAALNNSRIQQPNYVEVFTNEQIRTGNAVGLLNPANLPAAARTNASFIKDGIGGYKISAPDGKIYHFSMPVYHYEQVERTIYKDDTENHVSDKRQFTAYATHWLLTAITGPDYYDANSNQIADPGDDGFFVRLDHGKWSDGYVWRNPTDKTQKEYFTNIQGNINSKDFGYYQFGRKQLYYLDKIVSSTHTAYFVKDLRYDSVGCDLNYKFTGDDTVLGVPQGFSNDGTGGGIIYPNENFTYKRQLQLMLKKIVLVKNEMATVTPGNAANPTLNPLMLNDAGLADYVNSYPINYSAAGGFAENGNVIAINQEQNVIDVKDFQNFDYNNAIKVVELGYNYNLAVKNHNYTSGSQLSNGSPGVIQNTVKNPNHGKLTLKTIKFLGRNNFDYMPPYEFNYDGEYKGAELPYVEYPPNAYVTKFNWEGSEDIPMLDKGAKDEWGFRKVRPEAWSLTKISTPTGASINFEHEEDDFYTEAFSRRYWEQQGLQFDINNINSTTFEIVINKDADYNYNTEENFSFTDYFSTSDVTYLDFYLCTVDEDFGFGCTDLRNRIDISSQGLIPSYVDSNTLKFTLSKNYIVQAQDGEDMYNPIFSESHGFGAPIINTSKNCPNPENCTDGYNLVYKLLASKVPAGKTGGGLRVKSITLIDELNQQYKTSYYYNNPLTANGKPTPLNKTASGYKSSGITSYSPVRGTKFIPYQSELPSPGVMYEYVTMVTENQSANVAYTRYRFNVLRPVLNIFDPNIKMFDDEGTKMFEAVVTDHTASGSAYLDPATGKKIKAKTMKLNVNTSLVGQFRSVEEYNSKFQLMAKSEKQYLSGEALKNSELNRGTLKESFQSMKSIFNTNSDNANPVLKERLVSIASKEEYTSVLQRVVTTNIHGKTVESYSNTDPMTGLFNTVETAKADGTLTRVVKVPAYHKYPEMSSKVIAPTNKNMLTQDAVVVSSVFTGSAWKTLNANITTWNKEWQYRSNTGIETLPIAPRKVWRQHKKFVWKERLNNSEGTYATLLTSPTWQFDWAAGIPLSDKWLKVSEITRYTVNSLPIEVKDINQNFSSSKMADKNRKVLVAGNSRYTEMYYSGAEFVDAGNPDWFDGEVRGSSFRTTDIAHTGNYSVKPTTNTDQIFAVSGSSGDINYYTAPTYSAKFRPGKYKVSVWAYNGGGPTKGSLLKVNGVVIPYSEVVTAGCWTQLNFYFDIPANVANNTIVLSNNDLNGQNYYDDFRMHPISSSINSYVYDSATDELAAVLDANNMGSAYQYDSAGRLVATFIENVNSTGLQGGFRLVSQNKQQYKNGNLSTVPVAPTLFNCMPEILLPMEVMLEAQCIGTYESTFKTRMSGGSGNFSYQYKWLKDNENDISTPYTAGSSTAVIPYAAVRCDEGKFNKKWQFTVKVTDQLTGKTIEKLYDSQTSNCNFVNDGRTSAEISISKCTSGCNNEEYAFKIHPKDISNVGNLKYEYAYYTPYDAALQNNFYDQQLTYVDVTAAYGSFCPQFLMKSSSCSSGNRKVVYFTYRITNLDTGVQSYSEPHVFYGGCTDAEYPLPIAKDADTRYVEEGNLLVKGNTGTMVRIYNVNQSVK
ncbi:MAG TPA: hypothetical protein VF581_05570 [Flavobacterium sp.]|jgi:hypothetical protein